MSTLPLTIYLLKGNYHDEGAHIQDPVALDRHDVEVAGATYSRLYLRRNPPKLPDWREIFPALNWQRYRVNGFAGILILEVEGRRFAFTAGSGRHHLNPFALEENFGFKVVINSADPTQIRKIEKRTINQNPISSIDQLTRTSTLDAFRVDYYTDLVSKIRASSKVAEFGSIIDGRDSLQIAVESTPQAFPPLLRRCLQAYGATTYREYFPNIDNLSAVNDRALLTALDDQLVDRLNEGNFDRTWASMPEILFDDDFGAFVYSARDSAARYHDVELTDCLAKYSTKGRTFTKNDLDRDYVYVRSADGETTPRWRVWKCLYSELRHGDDEYVLVDGSWFRVKGDFIHRLNEQIAQIPRNTYNFPNWAQHTREGDYLLSLEGAGIAQLLVLDQDLIRLEGQSPIEFCDVLLDGTVFVHLKRYGGSDVLSYLFDQGRVSARLFLSERSFRVAAQEKCGTATSFPIVDSPNARDYTIAYLIGSKHADAQTLPLFARIVLLDALTDLRNYGYNVTLGFIPVDLV
jgi:uncharacterized protein (TIGR04141 family)